MVCCIKKRARNEGGFSGAGFALGTAATHPTRTTRRRAVTFQIGNLESTRGGQEGTGDSGNDSDWSLSPKRRKGLRIDDTFDEPSVEVRLSTPYASQDEGIEIETPVEDDSHSMEFEHRTFSFVVYLDLSHPISFLINDGG
jgi:hypothetical protein